MKLFHSLQMKIPKTNSGTRSEPGALLGKPLLFFCTACSTFLGLGDFRVGCLSLVYHHFEFAFGKGAAFFRFENTVLSAAKL